MEQHQVVLLYSGGMDSTLLLHMAKEFGLNPVCLLINYGQRHGRELETATWTCKHLEVHYRIMKVDLSTIDSALTGIKQEGIYQGVSQWHVPGRNTIFVGLAISLAETLGAKKVWYGANMEDKYNQFADCTQEWVVKINGATQISGSYPIEVEAPLLGMRKETIKLLAEHFGINEDDVHSGYQE